MGITKLLIVYFLAFLLLPPSVPEIQVQLQGQRPSETAVISKPDDEKPNYGSVNITRMVANVTN
jgi:hypothetical protein